MTQILKLASILALGLLAGCSKAPAKKAEAAVQERAIFISTTDCAESGKLSMDLCGAAVDSAVTVHEKQGKTYKTLARCAAAEGEDRCSQAVDGYRPRLLAFMITISPQPTGVPLYAAAPGKPGFRSVTNEAFAPTDDKYTFSTAALTIANDNGGKRKK